MVRFVLTLPVPTATIEQAFSAMKVKRLWHFTLNLKNKKNKKKIGNMPLFANYIGACPCFDTRLS